ncbi:MAG: beta-N-acetylhexosaminidase [Mariprofundaceae bacterium]|nr:beta-N-acetylhexosaminidase [Mariprofundaceae bacterium]
MFKHCVIGLAGTSLTAQESIWLKEKTPQGVILFARNVASAEQVQALLAEVRHIAGQHIWAAIDEEGGRVHRMPWSPFHQRMQADDFGMLYNKTPEKALKMVFEDALRAGNALKALGFTHNCAPVLDIFYPQAHPIIGNRAYASDTASIAALGKACMLGLQQAGIEAIGKHFPGHGRADADSHVAMPVVDADLATILDEAASFAELFQAGLKHVMTAHVRYPKADAEVATFSPFWLQDILKDKLGFQGQVWSDDLCMKGCGMDVPTAALAAKDAGCDVLLVCEPEGVAALMAGGT